MKRQLTEMIRAAVVASASAAACFAFAAPAQPAKPAAAPKAAAPVAFTPPPEESMPTDEFGKQVKLGEQIFLHTKEYAGKYVGNSLNCVNCHLKHVNTFAERLQGCFRFSMNGKAPPYGDEVLVALESYSYWLAKGAPVGGNVEGRGYPKVAKPALAPDYARGGKVYEQNCALCHGADGQGQTSGAATVFPPLWGPKSFNWGAGMHDIANASAFIKANMPLGLGGTLTDQQAWDVAYFMDAHERPQDPRFAGSVAETRKKYHDSPTSLYGQTVNGHVLGGK